MRAVGNAGACSSRFAAGDAPGRWPPPRSVGFLISCPPRTHPASEKEAPVPADRASNRFQPVLTFLTAIALMGIVGFTYSVSQPLHAGTGGPLKTIAKKLKDGTATADAKSDAEKKDYSDLKLKRFFPEKSPFGPGASSTSFSADGRYGAYLYRPRLERRHGNDLWILDTQTGEIRRATMVSVFSRYQAAARAVEKDRTAKAKKRGLGKGGKKGSSGKQGSDGAGNDDTSDQTEKPSGPLDGVWAGTLTGELIEDDGLAIEIAITESSSDNVAGTINSVLGTATITSGSFDAESGRLECILTDPDLGTRITISATLADDDLSGTVTIQGMKETLEFTATRSEIEEFDDDDADAESDDDESSDDSEDDEEEERELGDIVGEKDADDRRAPRYGGVQSFVWAPASADDPHELILTSGGDLYRYKVDDDELSRLTVTREFESGVQYLPDGSGYTYNSGGGAIIRVAWDSGLREQINPQIPGDESFSGYRMSPDGSRIAFMTTKGSNWFTAGRTVKLVDYRSRFANVREVPRHMPDDKMPDYEYRIYLYDTDGHFEERGKRTQVYTHKQTGPRDIVQVPEWAPDSSRVCFMAYSQEDGLVRVLESRFPEALPKVEPIIEVAGDDTPDADGEDESTEEDAPVEGEPGEVAREVYRFLHHGGPNTPGMIRPQYLADGRRMIFLTEVSGFRQLYTLDPIYEQLDALTRGRFEIYPIRMNEDRSMMFVTSTKEHPSRIDIYAVDLEDGEMRRLNQGEGQYTTVAVSDDASTVLANHVDFGSPRELHLIDVNAEEETTVTDSHTKVAHENTEFAPEYFSFENRHGQTIYGHMFKPDDWSADDKRPMLLYVYGGPLGTRKMIGRGAFSAPSYSFAYYMAKKHGWVTLTVDPRGASGFGGLFEKSNFERVGKPQTEDLVDAARWMVRNHGVDPKRMAMHGWSFGGFQTQMTLYTEPDVFAAGIAGAGPTEWENYNSWYSTGTIGDSETGKTDLKKFSLLPLAKNLKARLLLVHGMEDSNVLYQDTVRVYRELLKAEKETLVDLFLDPTGGHGLGGDVKSIGRYRKYERWLLDVLGHGEASHDDAEDDEEDDDENNDDDD